MGEVFSTLKIYGFLIKIASEKLELKKVYSYIEEAKTLIDSLGSKKPLFSCEFFYNVGIVKNYTGLFKQAQENFNMACGMLEKDERGASMHSKLLMALAINSFNKKDFDQALAYLVKLKRILAKMTTDYLSGSMQYYFGKIYLEKNDNDEALKYFHRPMKNSRKTNVGASLDTFFSPKASLTREMANLTRPCNILIWPVSLQTKTFLRNSSNS